MDSRNVLPYRNPVIIGSDLVGYAASAKLKHAGASGITIVDRSGFPACSLPARLYFRLWANPRYKKINSGVLHIEGKKSVAGIKNDSELIPCDGIAICGELIPNSELALLGGLNVDTITRKPVRGKGNQLSKPGWFAAGNVLGGFQSAGWCYFNGARVAGKVAKFIGKG